MSVPWPLIAILALAALVLILAVRAERRRPAIRKGRLRRRRDDRGKPPGA